MRSLEEIKAINNNPKAYWEGLEKTKHVSEIARLQKEADDAHNAYITAQRALEAYPGVNNDH